ncbi:MAG: cell envelope protein SmpA [Micavibrio sp.]|nr:cell envelope protein SmpA [Micavibrio sp.]|tara:strand:+ start:2059 stop:2514 length:456 start_codon:yes stop_codon:yes gene_type:complete
MTVTKKQLLISAAVCFVSGFVLAGCTPTKMQRGNMLETHQLERVEAGKSSRSDVLRLLGSPTTVAPFNDDIWYYIGQETEKRGILDPKVVNERIVAVTFSTDGLVESVNDVNADRINIPIERDATPTHGTETSAVQQIFGNLGKFNPQDAR